MKKPEITIIKSVSQYNRYCKRLEWLLNSGLKNKPVSDEVELIGLLIEKWDNENNTLDQEADPVKLLHSLMKDHQLKAVDLAMILGVSKGLVSDILNYKKGLSKMTIRKLAAHFKLSQEAFNRPYHLGSTSNIESVDSRIIRRRKKITSVH